MGSSLSSQPGVAFGKFTPIGDPPSEHKLNRTERFIMKAIASWSLIPWFDRSGLFPHSEMLRLYAPKVISFTAMDGFNLKGYWLPAVSVNPTTGKITERWDTQQKPLSPKTFILGHGYTSSPTAMLTAANSLRLLGFNVFLIDFRAHGQSEGIRTAIGFNAAKDIPAAIGAVKTHFPNPKAEISYWGYSMGAAALMLSEQALREEAYPSNQVAKRPELYNKHYFDKAKQQLEQLKLIILDSPYAYFNLLEKQKSVTNIAKLSQWSQTAGDWLAKVLNAFQHHYSKGFLDTAIAMSEFRPAESLAQSPLRFKPIMYAHGLHDTETPYSPHAMRNKAVLEGPLTNETFVTLNAEHSAWNMPHPEGLQHDSKGKPIEYRQMWRDAENYRDALLTFLTLHHQLPKDVLSSAVDPQSYLAKALNNPNTACLKANLQSKSLIT